MIIKFVGDMMPTQMTDGSGGYDLYSDIDLECSTSDREGVITIPTDIRLKIPKGYVGLLSIRSSFANKGLSLANGIGIIDSDYIGEIKVMLRVKPNHRVIINRFDRIAQIVFIKIPDITFVKVEKLENTYRGEGGFGSTGV